MLGFNVIAKKGWGSCARRSLSKAILGSGFSRYHQELPHTYHSNMSYRGFASKPQISFEGPIQEQLKGMQSRYAEVGKQLMGTQTGAEEDVVEVQQAALTPEDFVRLGKEYAELGRIVELIEQRDGLVTTVAELDAMIKEVKEETKEENSEEEEELREMAIEERTEARLGLANTETSIIELLTPRDTADDRSVVVEVRAGTGGDEASMFASELFKMYVIQEGCYVVCFGDYYSIILLSYFTSSVTLGIPGLRLH